MTITQFLEKHETLNGVILIQILAANPGRKFHILELANLLYNHKNPGRSSNPAQHWLGGNSLPMVDAEAIRQYKKEIARLRREQATALSAQDPAKAARCERELNEIQDYYRDVTLPGGRIKNFPLEPDLAYHSLLNAVKRVKAKARADCPELHTLIRDRVHIGHYSYLRPGSSDPWPDPDCHPREHGAPTDRIAFCGVGIPGIQFFRSLYQPRKQRLDSDRGSVAWATVLYTRRLLRPG